MKKEILITLFVVVFSLGLVGCSSGNSTSSTAPSASSDSASSSEAISAESETQKDFDGSGFEDTGAGTMYLVTAGGTSEEGNVPQVAGTGDPYNSAMTIELDYWDGDGSICTVYVDGMENMKINASNIQTTVGLTGDALVEGIHTVEVVKMDGDTPAIYKMAEYEMVY